jgi:hypothetical protein
MTDEGWWPLFVQAARFLGHSPEPVDVDGSPAGLPSRLPVGETAVACVVIALTAAAGLWTRRTGRSYRCIATTDCPGNAAHSWTHEHPRPQPAP